MDSIKERQRWATKVAKKHKTRMGDYKPTPVEVLGKFASKSSSATYTVTSQGKTVKCNCPGFTFKKKCRHTGEFK